MGRRLRPGVTGTTHLGRGSDTRRSTEEYRLETAESGQWGAIMQSEI